MLELPGPIRQNEQALFHPALLHTHSPGMIRSQHYTIITMTLTFASIQVKLLDWVVFALQHAFQSALSAGIVTVLSLAFILGLFAMLWGWLWNKKWSPFKSSLLDLFVCSLIALLFSLTSIGLHGLSGKNFGLGLSAKDKVLCTALDSPAENFKSLLLEKLQEDSISDALPTIRRIINEQQVTRWGARDTNNPCLKLIQDHALQAINSDRSLQDKVKGLAGELANDGEPLDEAAKKALVDNFAAAHYDPWCTAFDSTALAFVNVYKDTVTCLTIIWFSLLGTMLLFVGWRAYTDIRITQPTSANTPSEKVNRILQTIENEEEATES